MAQNLGNQVRKLFRVIFKLRTLLTQKSIEV
jgi:hypothetical protein